VINTVAGKRVIRPYCSFRDLSSAALQLRQCRSRVQALGRANASRKPGYLRHVRLVQVRDLREPVIKGGPKMLSTSLNLFCLPTDISMLRISAPGDATVQRVHPGIPKLRVSRAGA